MSKVIRDCIGLALLCSVIGLENSRHPLNQSDAKVKPIATWPLAFSRAWDRLHAFTLSSHWLPLNFPLFWLAVVITLVLVLWHSIEKRSMVALTSDRNIIFSTRSPENTPAMQARLNRATFCLLWGWQRGGGGTNHASRWIFKLNHVSRRTFLSNHVSRKNN